MTLGEVEGFKHRASWLNSIATAAGTTGILAPILAVLTGAIPAGTNIGIVLIINGVSVIVAVSLHLQGWVMLSELE
jgi:hypothetical protein